MLVNSGKSNLSLNKHGPTSRQLFNKNIKNLCLLQTTAGSLGYASNLTTDIPPEDDTENDTGVTDTILALANVTQEKKTSLRTTMATLTETLKALQE